MQTIYFLISSAFSLLAYRSYFIVLVWSTATSNGSHSSQSLGTLIAIMWIFNIISLPISGDLLDRYDKKKILLSNNFISICSITIFILNVLVLNSNIIISGVCASILATCNSVTSSSINSLIPFIEKNKDKYTKYIGFATILKSFQQMLGIILGSVGLYFINAVGLTLVILALYFMSFILMLKINIKHEGNTENDLPNINIFKRITFGVTMLMKLKNEKITCYIAMICNFILTPLIAVLLPMYVTISYHEDIRYLAGFEMSFALGMLLGGWLISKVRFKTAKRIYPTVIGNVCIGLGISLFSIFNPMILKLLSLFISGFGLSIMVVATNSVRAFAVPDKYKSRLESAIFFLCILTIPFGSQFFGYIISKFDVLIINYVIFYMGLIIFLSSFLFLISRSTYFVLTRNDDELIDCNRSPDPH